MNPVRWRTRSSSVDFVRDFACDYDTVTSISLGVIQRRVDPPEEFLHALAKVRVYRRAEGSRDTVEEVSIVRDPNLCDSVTELVRQPHRRSERRLGQDEHELLSAKAARNIPTSDLAQQEFSHCAQHLIARLMPKTVVEALEVVNVQHQDSHRALLSLPMIDLSPQRFLHPAAIEQASEWIANRLIVEPVSELDVGERESRLLGGGGRQLYVHQRSGTAGSPRVGRALDMEYPERLPLRHQRQTRVGSIGFDYVRAWHSRSVGRDHVPLAAA